MHSLSVKTEYFINASSSYLQQPAVHQASVPNRTSHGRYRKFNVYFKLQINQGLLS